MTSFRNLRGWVLLAGVGLLGISAAGCRKAQPMATSHLKEVRPVSETIQFVGEVERLEPGKSLERELQGGQGHAYSLALEAGQYVHLTADQRGIDIAVRLLGPDGRLRVRVDSPNGDQGPEPASELATAAGTYRIEVVCGDREARLGKYQITIDALRPATDLDRKTRFPAEQRFAEAEELRRGGTGESAEQALAKYKEALPLFQQLGPEGREQQAQTLFRIGWVTKDLSRFEEASGAFASALSLFRELGNRLEEGRMLNFISGLQFNRGNFGEALKSAQQAHAIFQEIHSANLDAGALINQSNAYAAQGQMEAARQSFEDALARARAAGSADEEGRALYGLGDVLTDQGKPEAALDFLNQALTLQRKTGSKRDQAGTLNRMANVYQRMERYPDARAFLEQALQLSTELKDLNGQGLTLNHLGTVSLRSQEKAATVDPREIERAGDAYRRALAIFRDVHASHGEAQALLNLGRYCYASKDYSQALSYYAEARTRLQAIHNLPGEVTTLFGSAQALHALGRFEEAEPRLEAVLRNLETLRNESESINLKSSYFTTKQHYYDLHVDVLMHLHEKHPEAGYDRRAIEVHEQRRARGLLDLLSGIKANFRQDVEPALLTRESAAQAAVSRTELLLMAARERQDGGKISALETEVRQLLLQLDAVQTEIRQKSPRLASLARPKVLSLPEIQKLLGDADSLLLVYSLGQERSFLWSIPYQGKVESHVLPKASELEESVRRAVQALGTRGRNGARSRELRELSDLLLRPVAQDLGAKRLVLVPDGALEALPFAALPDPNATAEGPLVLQHEIVYLPSASTLATLRQELADRLPAPRRIAVLADPVFEAGDPRLGSAAAGGSRGASGATRNWDLERSTRDVGLSGFPRLPNTRDEAKVIRDLIPEDSRFQALDFDASRATVLSGELRRYRVLHFATHGLLNEQHPELSGLVLSLVDKEGHPQDGFLRSQEICTLPLPAELVVLSACETGRGSEIRGEGIASLTRSFMSAGAPRVVVSLWNVSDVGTAELMKRFYRSLFSRGLSPAAALRQAQISMIHDPQWNDPYLWAPFIFQGEWRLGSGTLDGSIEQQASGSQTGLRSDNDMPPPNTAARSERFNGIDGTTGRYLPAPTDRDVLAANAPPADPAQARELRWWVERHGIDDPNRAPIQDVDPKDLASAGWGVIFAPNVGPDVREALQPLLARRRNQAGAYFKQYEYRPGQTKQQFLAAQKAGPGPADPKKIPYYLLLVGDPQAIPFRFQYELDVQYAVGRIHFATAAEYGSYAASVIAAETATQSPRPRQVTLFGVRNADDSATERTASELIEPLARVLSKDRATWPVQVVLGEQAKKEQLSRLLGGGETPALLFTASHGLAFPGDSERLLRDQGALLCQDWPGPQCWQGPIPEDQYFGAADVPADASLRGLISFHFACYSAGTPEQSEFALPLFSQRELQAPHPFVSRLAQRLLGHPNGGALAFLGHIDRAWTTSFSWVDPDPVPEGEEEKPTQIEVFESTLKRLLDGHPLGSATEYINQRHAEISVELNGMWSDREYQLSPSKSLFSRLWRANNDARGFVILGDPAVRLAVA